MPRDQDSPAPKKSLGQHFLRRPDICRRMAELLDLQPHDQVLEIGPGPGALTFVLEDLPHQRLLLLEKDDHWGQFHAERGHAATEVRCMDALTFPWEELDGAWKICGNLPYNVASPLIWDIASRARSLSRAAFMVQKEVGLRLAARPGGKDYGALSVWTQAWLEPRIAFYVGPGAFSPPPRVDSAVLGFTPRPTDELPRSPRAFAALVRICFQQRRKQLGGLLRRAGRMDVLGRMEEMGIAMNARPEELTVAQFLRLSGC